MKYIYAFLVVAALWGCNNPPEIDSEPAINVVVFPNPSRELVRVFVQNQTRSPFLLQIFDPNGKVFYEENVPGGGNSNPDFIISVLDHGTGAFHAAVHKDGSVYTQKFLIL